jgi:hypothetical protein
VRLQSGPDPLQAGAVFVGNLESPQQRNEMPQPLIERGAEPGLVGASALRNSARNRLDPLPELVADLLTHPAERLADAVK